MNFINLIGNMGPLVEEPKIAKQKLNKQSSKKNKKPEIKTIIMCGCGNHPINPKKDPYMQHNKWLAQFHPITENGRTDVRAVKGIKAAPKTNTPTYDFSGEEFEVSNEQLRKVNS